MASSSAREDYLAFLFQTMKENENMLYEKSQETYDEVIGLTNDTVAYLSSAIEIHPKEDFVSHALLYFLNHVLSPTNGAIYISILSGNIPACFMQLRLLIETLAKCYWADQRYSNLNFFRDRLNSFEEEMGQKKQSISGMLKDFDIEVGGKSFVLWSSLSHDWIHGIGMRDKFLNQIVEKSDIPPWNLMIPMKYSENDLPTLGELTKQLREFRQFLKRTMQTL